uniref:Putative phosphoglycolate/pyridoxal phosphate phosphatase family n=1 Tax=Tabanus bromius TaxID=304241 RepID=A0A0K8TSQ9_TABBR
MYKKSATDLTKLPAEKVKNWINSFDTVLADCDGVLWIYNDAIEGSANVINKFKGLGKKVYFVTNNSTKTRPEFLEKALRLGFNMTQDEIISTAYVAAQYLKNRNFDKKVYVVGSTGITKELDAVGIQHTGVGPDVLQTSLHHFVNHDFKLEDGIGAVIVGFDEHFSFPKMAKAASYLNDPNCLFIGTNTDERFPMPGYVVPGSGSILRSVEVCSERKAVVMGKPNPFVCEELLKDPTIKPERTLMIGDRCNTDILLGVNCGFQTLLVGTGIHKMNDVESWRAGDDEELKKLIPDVYLPKLGDLYSHM